jgi:hypothetical protein
VNSNPSNTPLKKFYATPKFYRVVFVDNCPIVPFLGTIDGTIENRIFAQFVYVLSILLFYCPIVPCFFRSPICACARARTHARTHAHTWGLFPNGTGQWDNST